VSVAVRPADASDAAALSELGAGSFIESFGHLYTREDLALFLANHSVERWHAELTDPAYSVCIGEADGQAVAYAKLGPPKLPFEPRGKPVELRQFYVLRQWHGTGAAGDLMEWVLEEAQRQGGDELFLSVFTDNLHARRYYERYGFQPVGRFAFMVGNHADEDIVMRKVL
jgi:ribosomal protein S18 acetylase RimI-like enzyme